MKVLLVDDNIYVLQGLKAGIDFPALGIEMEDVHTAANMQDAIQQMETESIPLVLTDIEMPNGTGLDLLAWIRKNQPDTVTLFCTNYADFDYARKAIELKSFGYYLKPIEYDKLQIILQNAVDEVKRRQTEREKEKLGEYWIENLSIQKKQYFEDILLKIESFDVEDMEFLAKQRHLPYTANSRLILVLLRMEVAAAQLEDMSESLEYYIMNHIVSSQLEDSGAVVETVIKTHKDAWLLVLSEQSKSVQLSESLLKRIAVQIEAELKCDVVCYYAPKCGMENVRECYTDIESIYHDTLFGKSRLIDIQKHQRHEAEYNLDDVLPVWENLFRKSNKDLLLYELKRFFQENESRGMLNRKSLEKVRISLTQLIFAIMWEKKIDAGKLIEVSYQEESAGSVEKMLQYLERLITQAMQQMKRAHEIDNVVYKVKEYIDTHYNENITGEALGAYVYLSSGYLAKLFKQETGKSLGNYVIDKRIEESCKLLRAGKMSVSEVSSAVGYDNFPYFSRLFKKKMGVSPTDYQG